MFDFFPSVVDFVEGLDPWAPVGALFLLGAVPYIESAGSSFLGVFLGVSPFLAVPAAVLGNLVCAFALTAATGRIRAAAVGSGRDGAGPQDGPSKRQQKITKYLGRFGVPGVCLPGPAILPSQLIGPALVGMGVRRTPVYLWSAPSIAAWGVLFGFFGEGFHLWLADRARSGRSRPNGAEDAAGAESLA